MDPLVVRTSDLAPVVNSWIIQHLADHPIMTNNGWQAHKAKMPGSESYTKKAHVVMPETGALQYIVEHSNGINKRAINRITRLETKITMLGVADQILQAIDQGYKLHNGEIPIIPNPRMSLETYMKYMEEELGRCV